MLLSYFFLVTRDSICYAHKKVSSEKQSNGLLGSHLILLLYRPVDNTDSNVLKIQIVELNERIRLLELALAELQALVSEKPHPLLDSQSQDTGDVANVQEEEVDITKLGILAVDTPPTLSEEDSFVDAFGKPFVCRRRYDPLLIRPS
jgi:hypothetical protein